MFNSARIFHGFTFIWNFFHIHKVMFLFFYLQPEKSMLLFNGSVAIKKSNFFLTAKAYLMPQRGKYFYGIIKLIENI